MDDHTKMALTAAAAGGYVLGRTKKGRLGLTTAALVMGRSLEPRQLLIEAARKLREVPQVAELGDQFKGELLQALRAALTAIAKRRLGGLTGSLGEHAAAPARTAAGKTGAARPDRDGREADEAEAEAGEAGEPREEAKAEPGRRRTAAQGSGAGRRTRPARQGAKPAAAKKTGGGRTPARGSGTRGAPAKKPAAAKRTASGRSSARSDRGR